MRGCFAAARRMAAERSKLEAARFLAANGEAWRSYWPEVEDQRTLGILDGAVAGLEAQRGALLACGYDDESLGAPGERNPFAA